MLVQKWVISIPSQGLPDEVTDSYQDAVSLIKTLPDGVVAIPREIWMSDEKWTKRKDDIQKEKTRRK